MRTLLIPVAALALLTHIAVPAHGGNAIPSLKDSANVEGEFVRLGDLIENAGNASQAPLFRAPELGSTGTIQVYRIIEAARGAGLSVFDTHGISEVLVTRSSRTVPMSDLERAVAETASLQIGIPDARNISVVFDSGVRPLAVEPKATGAPRLVQFNYDQRSQRFDGSIDVPGSNAVRKKVVRVSGYLYESAEVATVTRPMNRGEVIRDEDIEIQRVAKTDVAPDIVRKTGAIVGQAARRDLRPGQPIRTSELMKPELIGRGDAVTLIYDSPGVKLTVRAKALESGTMGDMIQVTNPQSKRTVQATVDGPGRVVVRPARIEQAAQAASLETTGSIK